MSSSNLPGSRFFPFRSLQNALLEISSHYLSLSLCFLAWHLFYCIHLLQYVWTGKHLDKSLSLCFHEVPAGYLSTHSIYQHFSWYCSHAFELASFWLRILVCYSLRYGSVRYMSCLQSGFYSFDLWDVIENNYNGVKSFLSNKCWSEGVFNHYYLNAFL